ncbi:MULTISPECIES: ABC transporter ATP-binding protein [Sphingobium]|uniref:ABC transporter n=2 Tax=Sphingobium TaxID=165695 RepID=A0ABQ1ENC6_SPHSA|nr:MULTISPECIES: ABC transporter ATP-binding protein [Sphingobium]AJR22607.1 ABC transporter [Sphingobium sp. YBL2]RYM00977.1 ABC transporter ATP-binding protein [Sphingobium fuliginis]UXC89609.1 ABC transporter ATP-binding protein [Sphingobium sp. RSMS]WDA38528.1 ABC transporter ATP-binding protein [Sphingobium sp. YC-XJ3]GFZ79057.1 ABC transporter [Sphingobium fuliginis]
MVTIRAQGLSVRLGRHPAVSGVDLELGPGELVGIIGPNGAGKSTLIRAMLGLVKRENGSVLIDGADSARLGRQQIARRIAYLPQGQTLHWPLAVERLVALGRLPHLGPLSRLSVEDEALIDAALMRADALHLKGRVATELSGGERARVLLARALAVGAPALIADEPLAALDPGHQIDVMDLLRAEARAGSLVVTVLHDLGMAARYCDRLVLMDRGSPVADGAPLDVLTAGNLAKVYGISARIETDGDWPLILPTGRTAS